MISSLKAGSTAALLVVCVTLGAQQPDRAQTEALSRRAADRLQTLHAEAARLVADERTILGELTRLELEREIRAEEFRRAEADAAAIAQEISTLDAQIAALDQAERAGGPELRARLVSLYKLGRGRYLRLLLSATDVQRIGQASRMVAAMAERDRERVRSHGRLLEQLATSRKRLEEQQSRLASLKMDAEEARAAADGAVTQRNARIREIDERRDLNARLSGELLAAQQKLQATLAGIASGSSATGSLPIGPFRGDLEWPVAGTIRQRFGQPARPSSAAANGMDIAASEGTPVVAIHDGVVAFADAFAGFGRLIIIDHGSQAFSLYGNLGDVGVTKDGHIQRGARIGAVGVSATGAAGLYFELRIDGRPVDPLQWLKKR